LPRSPLTPQTERSGLSLPWVASHLSPQASTCTRPI
jgi:hypothetical protein